MMKEYINNKLREGGNRIIKNTQIIQQKVENGRKRILD